MIVCSHLSVYGYLSRLFKCFMSKFYKMTLTFRIEFKVLRNLCNLFLILVQCAILLFVSSYLYQYSKFYHNPNNKL